MLSSDGPIPSNPSASFHIDIPPKQWRRKPEPAYQRPEDEELPDEWFIHRKYGKSLVNDNIVKPPPRTDLIHWSTDQAPYLDANLNLGPNCTPDLASEIRTIIMENWDAFDPAGVRRPAFGVQFDIDTGKAQPVCVRQPNYGMHEKKIMLEQLDALRHNGMIVPNNGPWAAGLVLAPKPHQEDVTDITKFI